MPRQVVLEAGSIMVPKYSKNKAANNPMGSRRFETLIIINDDLAL